MFLCIDYSEDKEYGARDVELFPNFDVAKNFRDWDSVI